MKLDLPLYITIRVSLSPPKLTSKNKIGASLLSFSIAGSKSNITSTKYHRFGELAPLKQLLFSILPLCQILCLYGSNNLQIHLQFLMVHRQFWSKCPGNFVCNLQLWLCLLLSLSRRHLCFVVWHLPGFLAAGKLFGISWVQHSYD